MGYLSFWKVSKGDPQRVSCSSARVPSPPPNVHVTLNVKVTAMVLVTHPKATHEWHTPFFFLLERLSKGTSLSTGCSLAAVTHLFPFQHQHQLYHKTHSTTTTTTQHHLSTQTHTPRAMFSTYPGQVVVDHPVKVPIEHRFDPYVDNGG